MSGDEQSAQQERKPHPFDPIHKGMACRHLTYVDHRGVECGQAPDAPIHTGTRPEPPELEFPYPPCSMCGEGTYHDGDGFCCDPCGAYWSGNGPGGWSDPDIKACPSTCKPFDRPGLAAEHESIRHHVNHCMRAGGHKGWHRSDGFTEWSDRQNADLSTRPGERQ